MYAHLAVQWKQTRENICCVSVYLMCNFILAWNLTFEWCVRSNQLTNWLKYIIHQMKRSSLDLFASSHFAYSYSSYRLFSFLFAISRSLSSSQLFCRSFPLRLIHRWSGWQARIKKNAFAGSRIDFCISDVCICDIESELTSSFAVVNKIFAH